MASHGDARKGIIIVIITIAIVVFNMIVTMVIIHINNNSPRLVLAMVEMEQIACQEKEAG